MHIWFALCAFKLPLLCSALCHSSSQCVQLCAAVVSFVGRRWEVGDCGCMVLSCMVFELSPEWF